MKKYLFLTLLIALVAVPVFAQRFPVPGVMQRVAFIQEYSSCAEAVAPPSVIATGDEKIPCFQVIIQYSGYVQPPPITNIQWHEFQANALTNDSLCTPNSFRPPFASVGECAGWWFDRISPGYEHAGLTTTKERTYCLWWLY